MMLIRNCVLNDITYAPSVASSHSHNLNLHAGISEAESCDVAVKFYIVVLSVMTPCSHLGGLPLFQRDLLPPFSWQKSGCPQTPTNTYVTTYPKNYSVAATSSYHKVPQISLCTTTYPIQGRIRDTKSEHVKLEKRKKQSYSDTCPVLQIALDVAYCCLQDVTLRNKEEGRYQRFGATYCRHQ
jgi:hypothetical protein